MTITYVALVHRSHQKAEYGVIFPDFPGCIFAGKTIDKALDNARDGIIFHIEGMFQEGETLPKPSSLEAIEKNPDHEKATPALIRIIVPTGHLKRLNISMDAELIVEIDRAAKAIGKSRSEFLAEAARQMIA